jgi:hypothetical protein
VIAGLVGIDALRGGGEDDSSGTTKTYLTKLII